MSDWVSNACCHVEHFVDQITPGTWPDWVAGIGTTAAFLIAAFTYQRSRADAHVSQARRVYSVHDKLQRSSGDVADVTEGYAERGALGFVVSDEEGYATLKPINVVKVTVHNNSDEIVSNVAVQVTTESADWFPPNAGYVIQAVGPGSKYIVDFVTIDQANDSVSTQILDFQVDMTFTDSAGNHWTRRDARPVEQVRKNPYRPLFGRGLITLDRDAPFSS